MNNKETLNSDESEDKTRDGGVTRVVIVGAGPAGLLAAIRLLRRNSNGNQQQQQRYHVTLIDRGINYGMMDNERLKRHRSWVIGLSAHGLDSLRSIPNLLEDYISDVGVQCSGVTYRLGSRIKFDLELSSEEQSNIFVVDRNYICAGLARYLQDVYVKNSAAKEHGGALDERSNFSMFQSHYETKVLFVDTEERCVHVRRNKEYSSSSSSPSRRVPAGEATTIIPYDLLLGCDGIRSIVRNAFVTSHRDFEMDLTQSFGRLKSFHVPRPKSLPEGRFTMLVNCLPNMMALVLPARGGQVNLAIGFEAMDTPCDEILLTGTDPNEVSAYFQRHFKALELDWESLGHEWVAQPWSSTGMGHCNFYHSLKLNALLLGDAAHATRPSIGQGMNTALADVASLDDLLTMHNDHLDAVLPAFSLERVKEGHALTELSSHATTNGSTMMMLEMIVRQSVHRLLHGIFPRWISSEPMIEIGKGMKLSVAYDRVSRLGYLQRSRRINESAQRNYFERNSGMITNMSNGFWMKSYRWLLPLLVAATACIFVYDPPFVMLAHVEAMFKSCATHVAL